MTRLAFSINAVEDKPCPHQEIVSLSSTHAGVCRMVVVRSLPFARGSKRRGNFRSMISAKFGSCRSAKTCPAGRQVVDHGSCPVLDICQRLADSDERWSVPHCEQLLCLEIPGQHFSDVLLRRHDALPQQEQLVLPAGRALGVPVLGGRVGGKLPLGG